MEDWWRALALAENLSFIPNMRVHQFTILAI